jgi:hypothetical protein
MCLSINAVICGQQESAPSEAVQESSSSPEMNRFTRILGLEDRTVPRPSSENIAGRKDATALKVIADFQNAVNITTWKGMQAGATFENSNEERSSASIALGSAGQSRLDVRSSSGMRSTRTDGYLGSTIWEDGSQSSLPPDAVKSGLAAFTRLFDSLLAVASSAIVDRGTLTIDQNTLHRITLLEKTTSDTTLAESGVVIVTDVYFDTTTHLLKMSASSVHLTPSDLQTYMIVTSYSDYRKVEDCLIPFNYSQSLNGQHQWSLQLSDVNLNPNIDSSYFTF